jgi:hypothetical protein
VYPGIQPVDVADSALREGPDAFPMGRLEGHRAKFAGALDLKTAEPAHQSCAHVYVSLRCGIDSSLQLKESVTQARELFEPAGNLVARTLSDGIIQSAQVDYVIQTPAAVANVIKQCEHTRPDRRQPRKGLPHPMVSTLHPFGQLDLTLAAQQAYGPHFLEINAYRIIDGGRSLHVFLVL